jgi:hypothetical protein
MDKENVSSKLGSHGSPGERRRERSVSKYHYHSSRHFTRRAHSSSSPSPSRKHNYKSECSVESRCKEYHLNRGSSEILFILTKANVKIKRYMVGRPILCKLIYQDASILIKKDRVYTWRE